MTRIEAFVVLGVGLAGLVAGLVWLFGPWGLIAPSVALVLIATFGLDIQAGGFRGQSLADPARSRRR